MKKGLVNYVEPAGVDLTYDDFLGAVPMSVEVWCIAEGLTAETVELTDLRKVRFCLMTLSALNDRFAFTFEELAGLISGAVPED